MGINMQIKGKFLSQSDFKFYRMLGQDIIAACLRTAKLALENPIPWSDMVQTKYFHFHLGNCPDFLRGNF